LRSIGACAHRKKDDERACKDYLVRAH
jgi:hypothetical protein